jgi:K(+)-stimulated pyrophosphate-energized sodium pump
MVSLLALGLVLKYNIISPQVGTGRGVGIIVVLLGFAAIWWAVWQSKRESAEMQQVDDELHGQVPAPVVR